jgi:hypothetical protein
VGHAHAAADGHDPAGIDEDEAEIIGQDIGCVVGRVDQADLEFARQIGGAIQRLLRLGADLGIIKEEAVMGASARPQGSGE